MSRVPRWYWPVALLPAIILCCLYGVALTGREVRGRSYPATESLGTAFWLYAALVLLGYLLLIYCWPRDRTAEEPRPDNETNRHRSDEDV